MKVTFHFDRTNLLYGNITGSEGKMKVTFHFEPSEPVIWKYNKRCYQYYFLASLCIVCALHHLQYFFRSILRVTVFRFFLLQ